MREIVAPDINLSKVLESGQCFNMSVLDTGEFFVPSGRKACWAIQQGNDVLIRCNDEDVDYWTRYFDIGNPVYSELAKRAEREQIPFLKEAIEYCNGLCMLRQDFFECLISFIVSQRKSIPAIAKALDQLCARYGDTVEFDSVSFRAFPTPEQLVEGYEKDAYAGCGLGYRDIYILDASKKVLSGEISKSQLMEMPMDLAILKLREIKGVGDKIANCVGLYSLDMGNAFPIDVWMGRVLDTFFSTDEHIDFMARYDGMLGVLQLYMYYYGRKVLR